MAMKQQVFIFFIALIPSFSFMAQKSWGFYTDGGFIGPNYSVLMECKDTMIEGQIWTGLKEAKFPIYSHRVLSVHHKGHYRIQDNVYLWRWHNGAQTVIYNFNLIEGDTINLKFVRWTNNFLVTHTDSILLNGRLRKRIFLTCENRGIDDIWIEGLGSTTTSFLEPGSFMFYNNICFYESPNSELWIHPDNDKPCFLYDNPFHCDYVVSSKDILDADKIEVSPNPFDPVYQKLTIKGIDESTIIHIVNSNGQAIFCGPYSNLEQPNMSPGIYFIKIHYGIKTITKKLIVL